MDNFTHKIIKGEKYKTMLPEGYALVLEGGGLRGFYSAGVFDAFAEAGVMFPYIIGVSAGAANVLSYISGQFGRNRQIVEHYIAKHQYVSFRNMLKHRSLFGYDFIFETIPQQHIFWDKEMFKQCGIRFLTGALDCETGKTAWYEKDEINGEYDVVRASCSVPLISKMMEYNGRKLLDGGVSDPIPIEKSIADGNTFHVVVLTRNKGYQKEAFTHKFLLRRFYGKYPNLIEAMLKRHEVYNRQLALCEQLEKEGKALIIRPVLPIEVSRATKDTRKVLKLYDEGFDEGKEAIQFIKRFST